MTSQQTPCRYVFWSLSFHKIRLARGGLCLRLTRPRSGRLGATDLRGREAAASGLPIYAAADVSWRGGLAFYLISPL